MAFLQTFKITLTLLVISTLLMIAPASVQQAAYFDNGLIQQGEFWRLITGHISHADWQHYFWNALALVVLAGYIEKQSPSLLVGSAFIGVVAIDALLLSPLSSIDRYCGLSGVLNTLLMVTLYLLWVKTSSRWVIVSLVLCWVKIIVEISIKDTVFTEITWPPYPAAHLVGALGGLWVICGCGLKAQKKPPAFQR